MKKEDLFKTEKEDGLYKAIVSAGFSAEEDEFALIFKTPIKNPEKPFIEIEKESKEKALKFFKKIANTDFL